MEMERGIGGKGRVGFSFRFGNDYARGMFGNKRSPQCEGQVESECKAGGEREERGGDTGSRTRTHVHRKACKHGHKRQTNLQVTRRAPKRSSG